MLPWAMCYNACHQRVGAWRRFSVLRLRQKNGAKRLLANRAYLNQKLNPTPIFNDKSNLFG